MDRLKEKFRNILIITTHTHPIIETNSSNHSSSVVESSPADFRRGWLEDEFHNNLLVTPNSSTRWSNVTESSAEFKTARESTDIQYEYDEDELSRSTSYRSMNSILQINSIRLEVMYNLRSIAERMITAGYHRECVEIYASVRKPVVAAIFRRIWIEKLSIGDVRGLERNVLELKIQSWLQVAKLCIQNLLASEKRLYQQIFQGDAFFIETFKGPVYQPFDFSEVMRINRRTPVMLFKRLHLFDALSELLSDLDILFGWNSLEPVRVQVAEILSSLFDTARETFFEFASVVLNDNSSTPVPGGRIHTLTKCVMNYLIFVSDYKQTMEVLLGSNPSTGLQISGDLTTATDMINFPELDNRVLLNLGSNPLTGLQISRDLTPATDMINFPELDNRVLRNLLIISFLETQLYGKCNDCTDTSLSYIFLMNNLHYIFQKLRRSPKLCKMIGYDYLRIIKGKFGEEMMGYKRSTWFTILKSLRDEGLHVRGRFSTRVLKRRFTTFNYMFQEVHLVQATWSVPDPQLREELRISILKILIPAYRSFLGRYRGYIESGKHPEKYIKYSVEDLEIAIFDFFGGRTVSHHTRK